MKRIQSYTEFTINEELMDMMFYPGDDFIKDVGKLYSDVLEKISESWDNIKNKVLKLFNNFKELISQIWLTICELSNEKWERMCNLLFQKNYSEVTWSDVNISNARRLSNQISNEIKSFFTDKSWSFEDDIKKINLNPEDAIEDKSLRLKTAINKSLTFFTKIVGVPTFTSTLVNLLTPILASIFTSLSITMSGISLSFLCGLILSIIIMLLFIWLQKKQINFEIKIFKDLRDVKGYQDETVLTKLRDFVTPDKSKIEFSRFDSIDNAVSKKEIRSKVDDLKTSIVNKIISNQIIF